jgi:hypothetical protein
VLLVGLVLLIRAICRDANGTKRTLPPLPPLPKSAATPPPVPQESKPRITTVRVALGPSPWAWTNRSHVMANHKYRFRALGEGKDYAGVTQVINESEQTILLLDFGCYARLMDDATCLLWWEGGSKESRLIEFHIVAFNEMRAIPDPFSAAKEMRERKEFTTPITSTAFLSINPWMAQGEYPLKCSDQFSRFEETLVLADHQSGGNGWDKAYRAIFVFDWVQRKITILPQDWFNDGKYDFGYQWIARVARTTTGSIVGDGIRLGSFELDESGKQVKHWLAQNEFHMIT